MSQCSSELQTNVQDLQLQTLINRVTQLESQMSLLESKLDTYSAAQAACNPCARDSTTVTCCETSQATTWTPTPLITMFEQMNNRMLQLENQVASTAALGAVIDDSSYTKLQNQDCLALLESQFNERMANIETLLEMATSHTITERNENIVTSIEQNSTVSPADPLQTLITIISQEHEHLPIDKCELLESCLENMTVFTAGSATTTVLSKHKELVEIVGILAKSSISAEQYTKLELLVDLIAASSGKPDEHVEGLKQQVKANAGKLKQIISKEKELDDKCATFQTMITEKTKKKNSKTLHLFDTQLLVLNTMSNECKAYKAGLNKLSTATNKKLRENLCHIINTYLMTELENQFSKNKLNSAAGNTEATVVSNLTKIRCLLVGESRTGKSALFARFINGREFSDFSLTMFETHSTDFTVDGVRYNLNLVDTRYDDLNLFMPSYYKDVDVVLICFRFFEERSVKSTLRGEVTKHWISKVRYCCPNTPVVLVNTSRPDWNSRNGRKSTFDFKEFHLAKRYHTDTYIECPYKVEEDTFSMEDTDAVFVAAVRAVVKAKSRKPQSALLDKFKLFFAGRRTNVR